MDNNGGISMKRLGKVIHLSKSGKLILRVKVKPKLGAAVLDENLVVVGTVFDAFGPVGNPYLSVKPQVQEPDRYVGHVLYLYEAP
jgi:RNA-binding protein